MRSKRRWGALGLLAVAWAMVGCASASPYPPGTLAELWRERMLNGQYGVWRNGADVVDRWRGSSEVASFPEGAAFTRYGIDVMAMSALGNGEWHRGGLLARVERASYTVELFGKLVVAIRRGGIDIPRQESFELFLLTRPPGDLTATLVRQWRFGPDELLLTGDRFDAQTLQRSTRNAVQRSAITEPRGSYRFHLVDAYLEMETLADVATVTVTGTKHPFSERVTLPGATN